jgi:choice-of-anchor B domain-containing protein
MRMTLALISICVAPLAHASHDESLGARFVQPGGLDLGSCLDHHAPCVSIRYALAQAEPGNTVKVGSGIFDLSGIDPETYLHGPVHATGGYDELDHYLESRPAQVQSIVTGVDARYRRALAVRGFHWAESVAAARRGVVSFGGGPALQSVSAAVTQCTQGAAGRFPCRNLDFQSQVPLTQFSSAPISAANVWGFVDLNDDREYAVLGLRNGTAIVEVTDPVNPREVVTIPGNPSPWREVKVYQAFDAGANRWRAYAYVTTEAANSGLQTIDLSGLPQTAALAATNLDTSSQHTLYVSNIDYATNAALPGLQPVLFVAGSNSSGGSWRAYSLANPAAPQLVSSAPSTRYMHDSTSLVVTGARAAQCAPQHDPCEVLVDFNVDQVEIWDVTNKVQPVLLGTGTNPNNRYIHSGWPTADGLHVIFHDELEEVQLGLATQIYTLSLANLRAPTVQVSHVGTTTTTDHNGYLRGGYYYVSHYRRGVVVYDATNPNQLVEVAHFDNYVTPSTNIAGTDGTWGVYPFLPSGNLLVSDIENGLFVLRDQARTLNQNVGRLGFGALDGSGSEAAAGGVRVRVQRVAGLAGDVSVQYAVTGGSAVDGVDYTVSPSSGTLSWGVGNNDDKDIVLLPTDDTLVEGAETLTVTLSSPTNGATIDGASSLTVTITDNDTSTAPARSGGGGGAIGLAWLALLAITLLATRHGGPGITVSGEPKRYRHLLLRLSRNRNTGTFLRFNRNRNTGTFF